MTPISFAASDGHRLAAYRFDPHGQMRGRVRGQVVIAAAMAVAQAFYAPFARYLARRGYTAWTFDYRGIGESLSGPRRKLKADLGDWLDRTGG